jgi:acetyltransferase-like isoleucine patch superfamily enzyme
MSFASRSVDNEVCLHSELRIPPAIRGHGNLLHIGHSCSIGAHIEILGNNNTIFLDDGVYYNQGWLGIRTSGATIRIGRNTTIGSATISAHESASILIGEDCMLSVDIFMDVSDMHPLLDAATGERINPAQDIKLNNHVWIGYRVTLLKGVDVGAGSVIAAGSVAGGTIPSGCVAAGNPARVIRQGIDWRRDF